MVYITKFFHYLQYLVYWECCDRTKEPGMEEFRCQKCTSRFRRKSQRNFVTGVNCQEEGRH